MARRQSQHVLIFEQASRAFSVVAVSAVSAVSAAAAKQASAIASGPRLPIVYIVAAMLSTAHSLLSHL